MKSQKGQILRYGKFWYARWRQSTLVRPDELTPAERRDLTVKGVLGPNHDGSRVVVRRQVRERLCQYGDRFRSRRDVQPLLDAKLLPLNEGRSCPESTLGVADYIENFFLKHAEREMKKSTCYGYKTIFRLYIKPYPHANIALRDFRCVDATNLLLAVFKTHKVGRKSLRHVKGMLNVVFSHAMQTGVFDGVNPARNAGIPRAASFGPGTHAYSADEVFSMLGVLSGVAKKAVALMYFCGLRPGEARAARWEDYTGKTLAIRASMWRTHLSTPKTAESVGVVPVAETLREVLAESRCESGFILAGPSGKPTDLSNLAFREIAPRLLRCAKCDHEKNGHDEKHEFVQLPKWRGAYAFRRGLATLATSVDSQLAAKSLLRHANIATTQQHYIKSIDADAIRAVATIDALFQKTANTVPN